MIKILLKKQNLLTKQNCFQRQTYCYRIIFYRNSVQCSSEFGVLSPTKHIFHGFRYKASAPLRHRSSLIYLQLHNKRILTWQKQKNYLTENINILKQPLWSVIISWWIKSLLNIMAKSAINERKCLGLRIGVQNTKKVSPQRLALRISSV